MSLVVLPATDVELAKLLGLQMTSWEHGSIIWVTCSIASPHSKFSSMQYLMKFWADCDKVRNDAKIIHIVTFQSTNLREVGERKADGRRCFFSE